MPIVRTPPSETDPPRSLLIDLVVIAGLAALVAGVVGLARRWHAPLVATVEIDLSPSALPKYTLLSLSRGFAAYALSLGFTLVYGTIAAHSRRAERILIPIIDILQGIPVLGFLPGVVLGMVALFPGSNVGLELACILMIFTGQVWNMTFSFYGSLRGIPTDLAEVARLHRFSWWMRFSTLEVPSATIGLVWNSMMSMAGGWFFLTVAEAFTLGNRDFRLPGIGSYMSVAIAAGDWVAMVSAVIAMVAMIVLVDQLVWRPALAWAQKFKTEDTAGAEIARSTVLDLLRRSRTLASLRRGLRGAVARVRRMGGERAEAVASNGVALRMGAWLAAMVAVGLCAWGTAALLAMVATLSSAEWLALVGDLALTGLRTAVALLLGALWTVPVGVWIGISPRRTRLLQPLIQVAASFPAPMIFPIVTLGIVSVGLPFAWGCVLLMLLGSQWYILFNVLAGATALPSDLREAADVYGLGGFARWRTLYLPAVFPHLVTGLITAAGGAWNASIVAELVSFQGRTLIAPGIGSLITNATSAGNYPLLAAGVLTMALALVLLNRTVWRRLYRVADERYSLNR